MIAGLFYFFYDKKVWASIFILFCTLLLCLSFSVKSIGQSQSKSIAWLNLKKHKGIIFKNGNRAIVLSDLKSTDKTFQYSMQPFLDSCRVNEIKLYDLNEDINTDWLKKKYNLVRFRNISLFIFDGSLKNRALSPKLAANYVYLADNNVVELSEINSNFDYKTLIIDGSNSDKTIHNLENQLLLKPGDYRILKRNKSFISISN
jgi:competence protein ComEC